MQNEIHLYKTFSAIFIFISYSLMNYAQQVKAGEDALGTRKYKDYSKADLCGSASQKDFFQQWKQAMMFQVYTHEWDDIEYFKLAVLHAEKDSTLDS